MTDRWGRALPRLRLGGCRGVGLVAMVAVATLSPASSPAQTRIEEAAKRGGATEWFVDVAAQTGLDFVHWNGMSGRLYYPEVVGSGGAMLDYDNDGDLDLYLIQGAPLGPDRAIQGALSPPEGALPLRDRLYRSDLEVKAGKRTLRFTDVTAESRLVSAGYGMGVATGDIDNDGWVDLYVTNFGDNQMFRNNGDGTFTDVTTSSGSGDSRWSVGAAFLDYDRDGWLDLLVVNYIDYTYVTHRTCISERGEKDYCLPSAYRPVPDRLFHNRGDGTFEDSSEGSGILAAYGNGLGVTVLDSNADGWLDLYVANDLLPNQLWLNQGDGTFVDEALVSGCALNADGRAEASMGVGAGDFDADGDEDLFMTHFRRETNTAFTNDGQGFFHDSTTETGLGRPSWQYTSFGTGWFDHDNDGWLDLFIANGAVTYPPGVDRTANPFPLDETNQLLRNSGGARFVEVSEDAGVVFELSEVSRGAVFGDIDNDGDTDVLVTNNNGPARLLVNQVGATKSWLGLRLLGGKMIERDMLGAWVGVFRDQFPPLWRRVGTDGSYASASDPRLVFGLDRGVAVRHVRVEWPDGAIEEWRGLPINAYTTLRRGAGREPTVDPKKP